MMNSCTNWQKLARLPAKVGFLARPGIPRGRLDWPTEGRFPRAGRGSATAATGAIARGDACIREKNCSTLDADTGAHRGARGALRWPRQHDFVRLADMPTLRPGSPPAGWCRPGLPPPPDPGPSSSARATLQRTAALRGHSVPPPPRFFHLEPAQTSAG